MSWIYEQQRTAAERVKAELAKPDCTEESPFDAPGADEFSPWALFPCFYGSYSQDFDGVALHVLRNLKVAKEDRWRDQGQENVAHHMFREVLCTSELCEYGTSPRVCFATPDFEEVLEELIDRWAAYSARQWGKVG